MMKPMMSRSQFLLLLSVLSITLPSLIVSAGEWREEDEIKAFHFETPSLKGMFVAQDKRDLKKGFGRHGFRGLIFKETGEDLHAPEGP
ncbi:MAG: hypothetical protein AAGF67_17150, partial [Verrucomicrobiota bacterium]